MKIYAILILTESTIIKDVYDLSEFEWFKRKYIKEIIQLLVTTLVTRYNDNSNIQVKHDGYKIYMYNNIIVVTDDEYPTRVVLKLLNNVTLDNLNEMIQQYRDPYKIDKLMLLEKDLGENKVLLVKTISSLLERGEKIDDLVTKSEILSEQSKLFYKYTKKSNSCCVIL
jgi:synaptobrevin family protein YKT6